MYILHLALKIQSNTSHRGASWAFRFYQIQVRPRLRLGPWSGSLWRFPRRLSRLGRRYLPIPHLVNRLIGRVSYIRIYLCYFRFRWKMVSLVQASMHHLMHHVTISLQQSKITLQNNCINNTSITLPTLSFLIVTRNVEFATFTQTVMIRTILLNTGSSPNIE